jgi:hypothetical protein
MQSCSIELESVKEILLCAFLSLSLKAKNQKHPGLSLDVQRLLIHGMYSNKECKPSTKSQTRIWFSDNLSHQQVRKATAEKSLHSSSVVVILAHLDRDNHAPA